MTWSSIFRRVGISVVAAVLCLAALFGCSPTDTAGSSFGSVSDSRQSEPAFGSFEGGKSYVDPNEIPEYSGEPYISLNDGMPQFSDEDFSMPYGTEVYGDLDFLGRCTFAFAVAGPETQPDSRRGDIQSVKPSGWVQNLNLSGLDHLFERSHLIAHRLTAENDNERNLITGTQYLNQGSMSEWEGKVAGYVDSGGHVLMRVTPVFKDDELVCRGVQMEAYSLEDAGDSVCFNVFCYNVQPGVWIDYSTGASRDAQLGGTSVTAEPTLPDTSGAGTVVPEALPENVSDSAASSSGSLAAEASYVLNTRSMKFHSPSCPSVSKMAAKNRQDVVMVRSDVIAAGYSPCANCNP